MRVGISSLLLGIIYFCFSNFSYAQGPNETVWGVYASGVGERLKPGMDPCWITYTVAWMSNATVETNLKNGSFGAIAVGINWHEATKLQRLYSQYFEDEPDGIYKLTPCKIVFPNINGNWFSSGRGKISLSQSGNKISGTAEGLKAGDHWGKGNRNGGTINGIIQDDGIIVLRNYWGDGTYSEDFMRISDDGKSMAGTWNWYTSSSKIGKKGSGSYAVYR